MQLHTLRLQDQRLSTATPYATSGPQASKLLNYTPQQCWNPAHLCLHYRTFILPCSMHSCCRCCPVPFCTPASAAFTPITPALPLAPPPALDTTRAALGPPQSSCRQAAPFVALYRKTTAQSWPQDPMRARDSHTGPSLNLQAVVLRHPALTQTASRNSILLSRRAHSARLPIRCSDVLLPCVVLQGLWRSRVCRDHPCTLPRQPRHTASRRNASTPG